MPPSLTPQEIARLQAERAKQVNFRDAMDAAVPQKQARAAELAVADGAFKKFFDYYNDDIIAKYDDERKALNGQYIAAPITEADVEGPASIDGSVRTTPTNPVTDIIRVDEFDGGPLVVDPENEAQAIDDQEELEDVLVNGYGPATFNPLTAVTGTALTALSTSLTVTDPTNIFNLQPNDVILVFGLTEFAVVKIVSITTPVGGGPPYTGIYSIQLLVAPTGTIASGANLNTFEGFDNTERTTKTAADPDFQDFMDYLIDELEAAIGIRIDRLDEQLVALAANQDPDGVADIASATSDVNDSKTFLTNYLLTTDISNTGLATLDAERVIRGSQITARVAQIGAAYTGQTLNYYDARYENANNRGNTARGTLRLQYATEDSVDQLGDYAQQAQDAIDAIDALLPP